jgi:hypothetical protein
MSLEGAIHVRISFLQQPEAPRTVADACGRLDITVSFLWL